MQQAFKPLGGPSGRVVVSYGFPKCNPSHSIIQFYTDSFRLVSLYMQCMKAQQGLVRIHILYHNKTARLSYKLLEFLIPNKLHVCVCAEITRQLDSNFIVF